MAWSCSSSLRSSKELRVALTDSISGLSPKSNIAFRKDGAVPSCSLMDILGGKTFSRSRKGSNGILVKAYWWSESRGGVVVLEDMRDLVPVHSYL